MKGKKTKQLDILLVVNQFLTGFDAKPLDVLYVDKKLEYHDLLQAFSRTNRVEKETKPFGSPRHKKAPAPLFIVLFTVILQICLHMWMRRLRIIPFKICTAVNKEQVLRSDTKSALGTCPN